MGVNLRPPNTMSDELKRAVQLGWDAMSDSYQSESRISVDDVHYAPFAPGERELGLLGDVRGKRALELACGAAQNAIALSKWGAQVTAMDFSAKQLRHARRLIADNGADVQLVRGDMERLGMFRAASFDLVLSSFGWEFVPDLLACFRECHRVLAPGGLLVVCTTHPLSAFPWDTRESALIVTDYFNPPVEVWEDSSPGAVTYFRTFQEMHDLLTDSGFIVERVVEPCPQPDSATPYAGPYWKDHAERLARVPFAIVFRARKKPTSTAR